MADLAELFASKLDRIPTEDGRELRFLSYSTFGQADDVKARVQKLAKDVGAGLVHLAKSEGWTFHHRTDPPKELPTGKRIARLTCATCGQALADLSIDDGDTVTVHPSALIALGRMDHRCA